MYNDGQQRPSLLQPSLLFQYEMDFFRLLCFHDRHTKLVVLMSLDVCLLKVDNFYNYIVLDPRSPVSWVFWISWVFLSFPGFSWVFLGFPGVSWVFVGFSGFSWVFLGFPGFSLVFLGPGYWVL